jgi:hypothetical protein
VTDLQSKWSWPERASDASPDATSSWRWQQTALCSAFGTSNLTASHLMKRINLSLHLPVRSIKPDRQASAFALQHNVRIQHYELFHELLDDLSLIATTPKTTVSKLSAQAASTAAFESLTDSAASSAVVASATVSGPSAVAGDANPSSSRSS